MSIHIQKKRRTKSPLPSAASSPAATTSVFTTISNDLSSITAIVCSACVEPMFITSSTELIDCNDAFLSFAGYKSKQQLRSITLDSFLKAHFDQTSLVKTSTLRIPLMPLRAALITPNEQQRLMIFINKEGDQSCVVNLKSKSWSYDDPPDDQQFYTFSMAIVEPWVDTISTPDNLTNSENGHERKRAYDHMDEFAAIADALPQMYYMSDSTGVQTYVNKYYRDYLGVDKNEDWIPCVHRDDRKIIAAAWLESLRTGKPLIQEIRMRHISASEHEKEDELADEKSANLFDECARPFLESTEVTPSLTEPEIPTVGERAIHSQSSVIEEMNILVSESKDQNTTDSLAETAHQESRSGSSLPESSTASSFHISKNSTNTSFLRTHSSIRRTPSLSTEFLSDQLLDKDSTSLSSEGNSKYRWFLTRTTPVHDPATGAILKWIGTSTDIHDSKLAHVERQRLIASERAAQEASRLKGEFLAVMSHEIRTPLTGVCGMVDLLRDTELSEEQMKYLMMIKRSANLLLSVIQDILDFSKIEAGRMDLEFLPFDINTILLDAEMMLSRQATQKNVELIVERFDVPFWVIGDASRIAQVLLNLLQNAIKFTSVGFVTVKTSISRETESQVHILFQIKDTGIGISEETMQFLFSAFAQADRSTSRKYGGSGLGLIISKSLVELMGGTIGLESKLHEGSTFWFELPLDKSAPQNSDETDTSDTVVYDPRNRSLEVKATMYEFMDEPVGVTNPVRKDEEGDTDMSSAALRYPSSIHLRPNVFTAEPEGMEMPKLINPDPFRKFVLNRSASSSHSPHPYLRQSIPRHGSPRVGHERSPSYSQPTSPPSALFTAEHQYSVLVAEDNEVNKVIIEKFLGKLPWIQATIVSDGVEALEAYEKNRWDIILLDQSMPRMGGDLVCRNIRENDDEQIIISLSANALLSDQERFLSMGMNDHISKPIAPKELEAKLKKWIWYKVQKYGNGKPNAETTDKALSSPS